MKLGSNNRINPRIAARNSSSFAFASSVSVGSMTTAAVSEVAVGIAVIASSGSVKKLSVASRTFSGKDIAGGNRVSPRIAARNSASLTGFISGFISVFISTGLLSVIVLALTIVKAGASLLGTTSCSRFSGTVIIPVEAKDSCIPPPKWSLCNAAVCRKVLPHSDRCCQI